MDAGVPARVPLRRQLRFLPSRKLFVQVIRIPLGDDVPPPPAAGERELLGSISITDQCTIATLRELIAGHIEAEMLTGTVFVDFWAERGVALLPRPQLSWLVQTDNDVRDLHHHETLVVRCRVPPAIAKSAMKTKKKRAQQDAAVRTVNHIG